MLQPYFRNDDTRWAQTWQELGEGVPTLTGFARLCSIALARDAALNPQLSVEAKALLFAAKDFGMIEIKGSNRAFDAPSRLLAAYVEQSPTRTIVFRNREIPEYTIRMLAGFRELCEAGLVMHHIYCDFSLTREGFALARTIDKTEVDPIFKHATDLSSAD